MSSAVWLQLSHPATSSSWTISPRTKARRCVKRFEATGAELVFLPPYSPDLNPIEMAFAKLKSHLRRIGARTIDALWRAIGDICALYSEQECRNYLTQAGYAPD